MLPIRVESEVISGLFLYSPLISHTTIQLCLRQLSSGQGCKVSISTNHQKCILLISCVSSRNISYVNLCELTQEISRKKKDSCVLPARKPFNLNYMSAMKPGEVLVSLGETKQAIKQYNHYHHI